MATRQDKVQISIAFLTDESKAYAKLIEDNKKFISDIKTAQKEGKDLSKVVGDIATAGKKVGEINLDRVAPAQLISRAQQLRQVIDLIPKSRPEYAALEGELKAINDRLATMRAAAKGVADGVGPSGLVQRILGVAGGVALFELVKNGLRSLLGSISDYIRAGDEAAKQDAALKSRIQSTNGEAQRSFEQLTAAAQDLAEVTLFDDDQIKRGEELLLTFTNIRSEVFDETLPVLLDLSTTMKQDVQTSAIQVGKALNDPIAGLKSLSRIGVTFSAEQKNTIATLVEMGDVAGAQRVILAELTKEFGGSARAAAQAGAGGYQQLVKRFGELKETVGTGFIAILDRFSPVLNNLLGYFEKLASKITDVFSIPVSEKLREQQVEFNALIGVLQNANTKESEREAALKKLKEQYPGYLKFVNDDAKGQLDLARTLLEGNKQFEARILLQATEEERVQITKRKIAAEKELTQALIEQQKVQTSGQGGQRAGLIRNEAGDQTTGVSRTQVAQSRVEGLRAVIQKADADIQALLQNADATAQRVTGTSLNELEASLKQISAPAPAAAEGGGGGGSRIEKAKVEADAAVGSILYLRQKISELQKDLEKTPGDSKLLEPLLLKLRQAEFALAELEARLEKLRNGEVDVLSDAKFQINVAKGKQISISSGLPTDRSILGELAGGAGPASELGVPQSQIDALTGFNEFRLDEEDKLLGELERMQNESDERRRVAAEDAVKQRKQNEKDLALQTGEQIAGALFSIERNNIEQQEQESLNALEREYRRKINAAEGNSALQEKLQRDLETKKAKIEQEAARKRKEVAIKEAIVAGALAFIRALPNPFAAAAVAVATAAEIAVISSQQFAKGGYTGNGVGSPDNTGFRPAGIVHEGEYVLPKNMVHDPKLSPVMRWLESRRLRGYADGGYVAPNTTPSGAAYSNIIPDSSSAIAERMERAADKMMLAASLIPREVKSRVVYQDIEDAGAELNTARDDASI